MTAKVRSVEEINKDLHKLYKERERALEVEYSAFVGKYYRYPNDSQYAHIAGILGDAFTVLLVGDDSIMIDTQRIKECPVIHWTEVTREEFEKAFDATALTIKGGMK